ncbi:hypothetical protein DFH09DRAFT_928387 [Mycena vulgaris]|nr:hypothetical protein DFH09DRAFT_928387 [Mycena vulgaris]
MASLAAAQAAPANAPLHLRGKGGAVTAAMNKNLGKWEDAGWIGVPDPGPMKALAACLRSRQHPTIFEKSSDPGCAIPASHAAELARNAADTNTTTVISLSIPTDLRIKGAKLSKMTQRLAYLGIRESKATPSRKATNENIALIQDAIKTLSGSAPKASAIWNSIRHKDISRQIKSFLWKGVHGAHRVGAYWAHIPGFEDRATCSHCDTMESMQHILFECKRPGQEQVWRLASELWARKSTEPLPPPSMGNVLGCALASFEKESKTKPSGVNWLYRVLMSESAYLIWKLRNDSVITKDGAASSEAEIRNKWVYTLNDRLEVDRFQACNRSDQGKILVPPAVVLQTWRKALLNEDQLPADWLREPRVLVGISTAAPADSALATGRSARRS